MKTLLGALTAAFLTTSALAQVPSQVVAQTGIPAGNIFGPDNPAGFFSFGPDIWFGDMAQGWRHYAQISTDPLQYQFDDGNIFPTFGTNWSIGGGTDCTPFCSVGQTATRGTADVFLAVYDHLTGKPGIIGGGGVYHVIMATNITLPAGVSPVGELLTMAPSKLPGNQPTAIAWNPQDGKVYVGFLKAPSYVRITNVDLDNSLQTVESVGTALNGQPVFGMAFNGADLYLATGDGLYVVFNVAFCNGNANNCGQPQLIDRNGGPAVAVVSDNNGNIYYAFANGGLVKRYTPLTGKITQVDSGYIFAGKNTAGLGFDSKGNLFVGDSPQPNELRNSGRVKFIKASDLVNLQ